MLWADDNKDDLIKMNMNVDHPPISIFTIYAKAQLFMHV